MYLFNLDFVWSISICLEYKIFEKQIHNKLYQYLMTNDLFYPCQRGFRAKRSTQTALIKVINEWLSNMDKVYYQQSGFGIHKYNTRRRQDFNLPKVGKTSLKEFLNTQSSNVGTQCSAKYANLKLLRLLRNLFPLIIFPGIEYLQLSTSQYLRSYH